METVSTTIDRPPAGTNTTDLVATDQTTVAETPTEPAGSIYEGTDTPPEFVANGGRPTREEMDVRAVAAIELIRRLGVIDVYTLAGHTGLSHPKALTLIGRLQKDGLIRKAGKEGRKQLYSLRSTKREKPRQTNDDKIVVIDPVPVSTFLETFAPGKTLRVIELRVTMDGRLIDLADDSGQQLTVAVAS